uniref:C2H2-type domain-containing protein n=1 Tax=Romanomermis culicivorax TaxID=13658 RepID=A0A915IFS8_ROMCU
MLAHAAPTMAPRRFLVDSLAASAAFEKRPIFQTTDFFPRCNKNDDSAADSFPNSVGTNRLIINNGVSNELIMNNGRVANKRNFDAVEDDAEDDVDDDGNSRRKSRQRRKAPPSKKLTSAAAIFENGNDGDDEWSTTPLLNGGFCAETSTSSLSNIMRRFGEFNNNHHPHHLENSPPPQPSAFSDDNPPALRVTGSFGHSPNNTGGCDDDSCTERRSPAAVNGCVSRSTAAAAATDNVLACPLCPYKTRGRETMRQHFYYHLPAQTQQEDRRNGLLSNDFDSHRCPFCPFVCDQQTQLVAHAATHFMNGVRRHLPSASSLNAATATTPPASSSPQHQAQ